MSITRYNFESEYGYGEIVEDQAGSYVDYHEYAELEAKLKKLEEVIEAAWRII